jgi:hypothetical protein
MAREADLTGNEIDIKNPITHGLSDAQQIIICSMQIVVVGSNMGTWGISSIAKNSSSRNRGGRCWRPRLPSASAGHGKSHPLVAIRRCNERSSVLDGPTQTRQIASITLRRPAAANRVGWLRIHPAPLGPQLALTLGLTGFFVKRLSNWCRAALVRKSTDDHGPHEFANANLNRVAQLDGSGGFDPIVIDQDLSELNRFLRKSTRLKKTRCPKPFIEPNRGHAQSSVHQR